MASPVSSLLVQIGADVSGLVSGAGQGSKAIGDMGDRARVVTTHVAKLAAAATAAGAAIVAGLVKSGIDAIDSQAKLAAAMGSTIDGLRAMQIVAGDAGVSNDELAGAMRRLNQRIGEAQKGTGEAARSFRMLGLDARELSALDTDERMAVIADRIRELGLSSSVTADILQDFGIRNENMIAVMRGGGDAIRAARQEVEDFGLSMSKVDARKVEMAKDAMERVGRVMESVKNQLAVAFSPILKELADRFNLMAKESGGFAEAAQRSAEFVMTAFGKVGDAIHGVRVVIKGLELAATAMGSVMVAAASGIVDIFSTLIDTINAPINLAIRALNALGASIDELPSMYSSDFARDMRFFAEDAAGRVGAVKDELHALAMQEMPSDRIARFFEDVKRKAQEAAEASAAADPGAGGFDPAEAEAAAKAKEEAAQAAFDREVEFLQSKYALEQQMQADNNALMLDLEKQLQDELLAVRVRGLSAVEKFVASSYKSQVKTVFGELANLSAGVAQHDKKMFELNKVAGIANAMVNTYEGITRTMKAYPYPINIGMAAAHAAAGFAQVNAIKSQQFGGGSAAPSLAGGTAAPPVTPVAGGTPQASGVLTVEGISPDSLFSGRAMRALVERLQDHIRDGGSVQFA